MEMTEITYEEFCKVNMCTGTITTAERVPKSNKLLKLMVAFGDLGTRQIVAGIGSDFEPEQLIGTQIVAVLNLAPRKLMGIESHGMILATRSDKLCLVTAPGSANGSLLG